MSALSALVKLSHWLVCAPHLDLLKECLPVGTVGTPSICLSDISPRVLASQDIINLLSLEVNFVFNLVLNRKNIGTSLTKKSVLVTSLFYKEEICTCRTEEHLFTINIDKK